MRGLCDVWPSWHGTARRAPRPLPAERASGTLGDRARAARRIAPPPLAPASPPFAVSTCGVAISACGVLTFRNARRRAHPPTEGARAAAGSTAETKALPSELMHRIAPQPSPVGAGTAIRVESSNARANASPLRSIEPGSEKKRGPHSDRATSEKARNALRTLRFRDTASAAAGSESRSATVCASVQFKSKASVSCIQRAASKNTQERTLMVPYVQCHHGLARN